MYLLAGRNKQLNFRSRPAAVSCLVCGAVGSYISHMWVAGCASWVCEAGCLWEVWVVAAINGSRKLLCHFLGHCWKGRSRPAGDRRETDALSHQWQCSPTAALHPHPTSALLGKHCSIAAWLRVPGESWHPTNLLDNECLPFVTMWCKVLNVLALRSAPGPRPLSSPSGLLMLPQQGCRVPVPHPASDLSAGWTQACVKGSPFLDGPLGCCLWLVSSPAGGPVPWTGSGWPCLRLPAGFPRWALDLVPHLPCPGPLVEPRPWGTVVV